MQSSGDDSWSCPPHSVSITAESDCERAVILLKIIGHPDTMEFDGDVNKNGAPKGCYYNVENGNVYYNKHTGVVKDLSSIDHRRAICRTEDVAELEQVSGPAPTPAPATPK